MTVEPRVFVAYTRLLMAQSQQLRRLRQQVPWRSIAAPIVLAATVCLALTSQSPMSAFGVLTPLWALQTNSLVRASAWVGALLAHVEAPLAPRFSYQSFRRFSSSRRWLVRSYIYPLFSSVPIAILTMVGAVGLGWRAPLLTVVLYFSFATATRCWWARALVLAAPALAFAEGVNAGVALASTLLPLVFGIAAEWAWPLHGRNQTRRQPDLSRSGLWWKELAALRHYQSDSVFVGLALAFTMLFSLIIAGKSSTLDYKVTSPVLLAWISATPFTRIVHNLLGTELSARRALVRFPDGLSRYLCSRSKNWSIASYLTQACCGVGLVVAHGAESLPALVASAVLVTESNALLGLVLSILFPEAKQEWYSPLGSTSSRSVLRALVVSSLVGVSALRISSAYGVTGLVVGASLAWALGRTSSSTLAQWLVRERRDRLLHGA